MGDLVAHLDSNNSHPPYNLDYNVAAGFCNHGMHGCGAGEVYHVLLSLDARSWHQQVQFLIISEKSLFKGPICVEEQYIKVEVDGVTFRCIVDMVRFFNSQWQYSLDGGHEYVDEEKLIKLGAEHWPN